MFILLLKPVSALVKKNCQRGMIVLGLYCNTPLRHPWNIVPGSCY